MFILAVQSDALSGKERVQPSREERLGLQRTRSAGTMDSVPRKQVAQRDGDVSVADLIRSVRLQSCPVSSNA